MGKLMSIETGFTCNSRCHYCTQLDYRGLDQASDLDLSTEAIRARILWAAQAGHEQIGFSGGEPTIRPDFIELLTYAREQGFAQIGVTSNGRMFAYREFAERAVAAGLNSITFSLHGPTAAVHDWVTAAPKSLEHALAGLGHLRAAAKRHKVHLRLMNNQILLPETTPHIAAMVELLAPQGVKLFMVQPFIAQRSNVDDLARFYVPYEQVVQAVAAALPALRRWGARIKPYNVPNCVLWPLGREFIESQDYDIATYREFEQESTRGVKGFRARQWYRISDCRSCKERCPGFRVEQLPQADMAAQVMDAADDFSKRQPSLSGPLTVMATELFTAAGLLQLWADLAAKHAPVAWMTGAAERTPRAELVRILAEATARGDLAEVVVVGQPVGQRFEDQRVQERGNIAKIRNFLASLRGATGATQRLPKLAWMLNPTDALDLAATPEWRQIASELSQLTDAPRLLVSLPNYPPGEPLPSRADQLRELPQMAARLAEQVKAVGLVPVLARFGAARGLPTAAAAAMAHAEELFAAAMPSEDWSARLFEHPFSTSDFDFVSWAPPWIFARAVPVAAARPVVAQ